jgi:hypothetical protein
VSDIHLNLNGEPLVVTERDMIELHAVAQSPGWPTVKRLLRAMEAGTRRTLEDAETPMEQIRALQGRLSVVTDVADLLDKGVLQWVQSQRKD